VQYALPYSGRIEGAAHAALRVSGGVAAGGRPQKMNTGLRTMPPAFTRRTAMPDIRCLVACCALVLAAC